MESVRCFVEKQAGIELGLFFGVNPREYSLYSLAFSLLISVREITMEHYFRH